MKVYLLLEVVDQGDHVLGVFYNEKTAVQRMAETIKNDPLSAYRDQTNSYYVKEFEVT